MTASPHGASLPRDSGGGEHEGSPAVEWARIALVAAATLATWLQLWRPVSRFDIVAAIATAIGVWPILKEAAEAVRKLRMSMELSMLVALVAALAIGESLTALLIVLFVLVAEMLEHLTVGRGKVAIRELLELLPAMATVTRDGQPHEVRAEDVRVGDVVWVRPGSRVPVDGVVVRGSSFVDQAVVTGEALAVEKQAGARVYAGSMNQAGALEVRAEAAGRATAFGRIVEAVEGAERSRAPVEKLADRLAGILVYVALAAAAATYAVTRDSRSAIAVVLVAGACGVAAGTPLAVLGAIGQSARRGVVVKGGRFLEALGLIDTVVLDKTGTVTFGEPEVREVVPTAGATPTDVLASAAAAERLSEHPLGRAILRKAAEISITVASAEDFGYAPGKGIHCRVGSEEVLVGNAAFLAERGVVGAMEGPVNAAVSEVLVARAGHALGAIRVADVVRPEAAQAVRRLRSLGIRTVLLTGDRQDAAEGVGAALGVDETVGDLLPADKLARIRALAKEGRAVAMVGDGINDVPALLEAKVGIAMGSGTDVAKESAPVTLIGNNLGQLVESVEVARRCRRIILFNFYGTLAVDFVGMAFSAAGFVRPLAAAVIHVTSELAFILNSARLLPKSGASVAVGAARERGPRPLGEPTPDVSAHLG